MFDIYFADQHQARARGFTEAIAVAKKLFGLTYVRVLPDGSKHFGKRIARHVKIKAAGITVFSTC